jgi:hypothetical protein
MRLTAVVVFCRRLVARFVPPRIAMQVVAGKQRERASQLCSSSVMTLLRPFHQSHYRTLALFFGLTLNFRESEAGDGTQRRDSFDWS